MSLPRIRTTAGAVLAGALVSTLSGCGGFDSTTNSSATTTPTTAPVPPAAPPPTTASAQGGSATCSTSSMRVKIVADPGGGAAGSTYSSITFTNVSDDPCVIYGWPGVSYVGHRDGTQVGAAAVRQGKASPIALQPGRTVSASLRESDAGNYAAATCHPVKVDGLRVYPPNQKAAVYLPHPTTACAASSFSLLRIDAVTAG